ncbi:hypothetical protein WJS89_10515 [Sphingomicrobium sp. XHP0235]|uniref:hypothetical protein n=1 Tax=Sphingomicrobium aquimarinum TaxID=3133971 RepID=UPI0031FEC1AC
MLGLTPSAPVSGLQQFTVVTASLAAAISLSLSPTASGTIFTQYAIGGSTSISITASAIPNAYAVRGATAAFALQASIIPSTIQGMLSAPSVALNLVPKITVAGKSIEVAAVHESFDLLAGPQAFTLTALPETYTLWGTE